MPYSSGEITYFDLAKRTAGGKVRLDLMTEEFVTQTSILGTLPVVESTEKEKDTGTFLDGWEYNKHTQLTDLDHGPKPTKHDSYAREDIMSYRDAAIETRKKHYDYGGAEMASLLTQETSLKIRDLALDNEHDIFYGDPRDDERAMLGLYPRFWCLTDMKGVVQAGSHQGEISPYRTFSAGGTASGKLSSIFMVVPSARDGACIIVPKGSLSGGMHYEKGQWRGGEDEDGGFIYVRTDLFSVQNGLSIRNRQGVVRIANIDYSTEAGIKGLIDVLYNAVYSVPAYLRSRLQVYCNDEAIPKLAWYFNSQKYPTSAGAAKPEGVGGDFAIPGLGTFHGTVHITQGEEPVA